MASVAVPAGLWPEVPRWLASCDAWRLRALAEETDGGHGVQPQRGALVHAAVTRLLQQGRLRVFELMRHPLPDEQKAQAPRVASQAVTPSMLRGAEMPEPAPAQAVAEAPPPLIDQDRQAAVLRRAAESGVPFCARCSGRCTSSSARAMPPGTADALAFTPDGQRSTLRLPALRLACTRPVNALPQFK